MPEKKVYLLLTDTGTLFTKAIKLYTRKPYNHASISFDEHLSEVYSFGRKCPKNPFIGGFIKENIHHGLLKNASCAIYSLTINTADYDRMQQYVKKIEAEKENYRYNLIGLFAILLKMNFRRENAFFCSQFVASVLNQSGNFQLDIPISFVTPDDLQSVENFEFIYEGRLSDYRQERIIPNQINKMVTA